MRIVLAVAVFLLLVVLLAGQSAPPSRPPYIFFSHLHTLSSADNDRNEVEQKINDLATEGYRLVGLQESATGLLIIAMQDVAPLADMRYEYKLLAGHWQRYVHDKHPFPAQLSAAGDAGYRCVSGTLLFMAPESWVARPNEKAVAVERVRGSTAKYEYRFSRAVRASTSFSNLRSAMRDGFVPLMTYSFPGERELLLEKSSDTTIAFDPGPDTRTKADKAFHTLVWPDFATRKNGLEIVNLTTRRLGEQIAGRLNNGQRLLVLSSGQLEAFGTIWADIPNAPQQKFLAGKLEHDHKDPRTVQSAVWDKIAIDLNATAAQGYAISLRPMFVTKGNFALSEFTLHYFLAMEQQPNAPLLQYRIIRADTLPEMSEAVTRPPPTAGASSPACSLATASSSSRSRSRSQSREARDRAPVGQRARVARAARPSDLENLGPASSGVRADRAPVFDRIRRCRALRG